MMSFSPVTLETNAVKCELAADSLRAYRKLSLQVLGWSMFPAVQPSDVLVVDRICSSDVADGDIILFTRDRRLFAHRVIASKEANGVLTRGDAMPAPDAPVKENELLGRVSSIVRNGRHIQPRKTLRISQRIVGTLFHRSEIAARVIVGIHGLRQASQVQTA